MQTDHYTSQKNPAIGLKTPLPYLWSALFVLTRAALLTKFFATPTLPALAFAISETMCLAFTLRGLFTGIPDNSWRGYLVPVCYMSPLLLTPHGAAPLVPAVIVIAAAVTQLYLRFSMMDKISIGVPVWKSLVDHGAWRIIRHPLAATETIAVVGLVSAFPTLHNLLLLPVVISANLTAALIEEKFLESFASYRDYTTRVRWLFVPGIM
jgi:protein-S-isoprenylcysteine O-methyltransferase Ste14